MMVPTPSPSGPGDRPSAALTCYLGAMLAMAKSMRSVCSRAGLVYGDRLMRLPRRLGFDAAPEKLKESRELLEADLAEYTEATTAWVDAGSNLAREILEITTALGPCTAEGQNLHTTMLEDLAEQMSVSAEVDSNADLRAALKRYALGLRSYLRQRGDERLSSLKDLQCRADQLAKWLTRADPANSTDLTTGLPNRLELEGQLEVCWHSPTALSALIFEWEELDPLPQDAGQAIAKQLADRLADLVRPRDMIGRWGDRQFAVIFECSSKDAAQRAGNITHWLAGNYSAVVEGAMKTVPVGVKVSVLERESAETPQQMIQRIEQLQTVQA